jgi:hypothetical protein
MSHLDKASLREFEFSVPISKIKQITSKENDLILDLGDEREFIFPMDTYTISSTADGSLCFKAAYEGTECVTHKVDKFYKTVWDLAKGDTIYVFNDAGHVVESTWDGGYECQAKRGRGRVFLTEDEAYVQMNKELIDVYMESSCGVPFQKCRHEKSNYGFVISVDFSRGRPEVVVMDNEDQNLVIENTAPFLFPDRLTAQRAAEGLNEKTLIAYLCGTLDRS